MVTFEPPICTESSAPQRLTASDRVLGGPAGGALTSWSLPGADLAQEPEFAGLLAPVVTMQHRGGPRRGHQRRGDARRLRIGVARPWKNWTGSARPACSSTAPPVAPCPPRPTTTVRRCSAAGNRPPPSGPPAASRSAPRCCKCANSNWHLPTYESPKWPEKPAHPAGSAARPVFV